MMKHNFKPDWADLGAKMRWMTGVVLGASALLGACATGAVGEEVRSTSETREVRSTSETRVVRMVVDRIDGEGEETTRMCVFVPAGDEAAGALSCSGDDVRVFEFGGDHGRQIIIDGERVFDDGEITALVQERLAAVQERLAEVGEIHIELIEEYRESEEYQDEMAELAQEMEELREEIHFDFEFNFETDDIRDLNPEERAEFDAEMAEFQNEMAELGAEMARLQTEGIAEYAAELAETMAGLEGHRVIVRPNEPRHPMRWFDRHDGGNRNVIRINQDGVEHITIIEHGEDEDGNPRVTIRTTDPSSVEVIQIEPDELHEFTED